MMECGELARSILAEENRIGHSRTVLVGDLNMNPFEKGMVAAPGLHAVMTRQIAGRGSRIVQDRSYRFFYNPMWSHLGDSLIRPPGSYYRDASEHVNYYWNVFDQVLVRPDLLGAFKSEQLRILDNIRGLPLTVRDGRPDRNTGSDHLPLLFSLDL